MINNIVMYILIATLLFLILVLIIFPCLQKYKDNFSGYGFNQNFDEMNKTTVLVPLNIVTKSTDFKLFSLFSQLKFQVIKPYSYEITKTEKGIISKTPNEYSSIILFSGLSDFILKQHYKEVWPINCNSINNNEKATVYNNNNGHFSTIIALLEGLNYKDSDRLNNILYDFRNLDLMQIVKQFKSLLKKNTVIIAYDFGCTIANLCLQALTPAELQSISKFLLICPTIGGVPMTLRDYFSGNSSVSPKLIENYDSVLLSLPNQLFYKMPVIIYNSVSYQCKDLPELFKIENKPVDKCLSFLEIQHSSLEHPGVNCIIVANDQYSTPVAYDYKNNLKGNPVTYSPKNNNKLPNGSIRSNQIEGLQAEGDGVVPIDTILQLQKKWKQQGTNCELEIIKDFNHFTILKSYELALIILSII